MDQIAEAIALIPKHAGGLAKL